MRKSMNNETRATIAICMINKEGATWEDVGTFLGLSDGYCQQIVREHYKGDTSYKMYTYNRLLVKARENKKIKTKKELDKIEEDKMSPKKVVVVETGYLIENGIRAIEEEALDMYIPSFNIRELEKLSKAIQIAEDILLMYHSTNNLISINLRGEEEIFKKPMSQMKDRSIGVVALCCHLWTKGYKVILKTNSREIEELAKMQDIDIDIVRTGMYNF